VNAGAECRKKKKKTGSKEEYHSRKEGAGPDLSALERQKPTRQHDREEGHNRLDLKKREQKKGGKTLEKSAAIEEQPCESQRVKKSHRKIVKPPLRPPDA